MSQDIEMCRFNIRKAHVRQTFESVYYAVMHVAKKAALKVEDPKDVFTQMLEESDRFWRQFPPNSGFCIANNVRDSSNKK